jgi:ABC-type branched-subunit amino acid transport system ATPase component
MTLKEIDLEVKKGEFVIIIGKIGAGKTSLLQAILNEMTFVP